MKVVKITHGQMLEFHGNHHLYIEDTNTMYYAIWLCPKGYFSNQAVESDQNDNLQVVQFEIKD